MERLFSRLRNASLAVALTVPLVSSSLAFAAPDQGTVLVPTRTWVSTETRPMTRAERGDVTFMGGMLTVGGGGVATLGVYALVTGGLAVFPIALVVAGLAFAGVGIWGLHAAWKGMTTEKVINIDLGAAPSGSNVGRDDSTGGGAVVMRPVPPPSSGSGGGVTR